MEARIRYPEELPVSAHRVQILDAVRHNPAVVVCGDTGSGKTTQLPKMMLELGLGANGRRIAVTQPRRLAAVAMAERVAHELGEAGAGTGEAGDIVGYRHRYAKKTSSATRVEFMTDGVLLAETKADPLLRAYDAIIVDEAHERSLNIDFLLGILKRILARRRDLKVVVSSATLDTGKFAAFFGAPVVNVPGRLFPVEMRYRPPADGEDFDLPGAVAAAIRELPADWDTLVFLPGEREIRETHDCLAALLGENDDIIPLLASLPADAQRRAFRLSDRRRIVLATNVAETSVTIPGIRAVVDSGVARVSRYVHRTHVQRLQIEPVSQASARQRAGRCGRVGPGICVRLYSEEDLLGRDAYTTPEVMRTSLAGAILTMLDLRIGEIDSFPFLDPPKPAMVREGLRELLELGAVKSGYVLTDMGRRLARMPVEPRCARILFAAAENAVLPRVLPIVAAMACDDPRRRSLDEREKVDRAQAKWRVAGSDFLGTLRLWTWWKAETANLSQTKARRLAKENCLSYPKMREWCELGRQLESLCRRMGLSFAEIPPGETSDAAVHMSLLSGLLGRIGRYHAEDREYRGAHAIRFALHPASSLSKGREKRQPPEWIVCGELVETARLFARQAAVIDSRWIEPVAKGLCKHHVHSPAWDAQSGYVRATEQVTLYGLVIVEARRCDYARFDPAGAREIFIRHGLVLGDFPRPTPVLRETLGLLAELRELAEKTRRAEIFDAQRLVAHFDAAIPEGISDATALKKWLAHAAPDEFGRFRLRRADWWPEGDGHDRDFPDEIEAGGAKLHLSYRNSPDDPATDGITCTVRKDESAALAEWRADWLVPGLLAKKVSYMLLSLPNSLQRLLKPIDDSLAILMDLLDPACGLPLETAIRRAVEGRWGFRIPKDAWANTRLPPYLKVRFVVVDDDGRVVHDSREMPATERPKPPPPPKTADIKLDPELRRIVKETLAEERRYDLMMGTGAYPEQTVDAVLTQLAWMTFEGFPALVPRETLLRYPRYLKAIGVRLERAKNSPASDRAKEARFAPYWQRYREALKDKDETDPAALARYRWLLEELRIQIFAPELKTFEPVGPKRLDALLPDPAANPFRRARRG